MPSLSATAAALLVQYLLATPYLERCEQRDRLVEEKAEELHADGVTTDDLALLLRRAALPQMKARSAVGLWCAWLQRGNWKRELGLVREQSQPKPAVSMTHYPGFPLGIPSCECEQCQAFRAR